MDDRLQTAIDLATKAGSLIRENFGNNQNIELKSDHSPVTETDKQINSLVAETLYLKFPEDGLLGEEESYGSGNEKYQWICDPLDGTKPFILGLKNSVFMLALSEDGVIMLSVVYDPHNDKLYRAVKGKGSYCNDKPIHVSQNTLDDGYMLVGPDSFKYAIDLKKASLGVETVPGTGFKCVMIASGQGLGMINDSADFHDIGPGSLIIEEAGGKVTNLQGEPLKYNQNIGDIIVSNGVVHEQLIKIANSA